MDLERTYDCVVVGSGASGGTLAYGLAKRGAKVLLVERGTFVKPPASHGHPPDTIGFPQSDYGPSRSLPCVGGPTKFYGAALYRLREVDFQATRLETGESAAWPITYSELEPYYSAAEQVYAVHGASDGDPTEPFRSAPYPYPPIPHQGMVEGLVRRLQDNGVAVSAVPRGLDYREGGKCVLCATCDAYYCRLDAKMDAEIACIRPAVATGNVTLATDTECLRVLFTPDGKRATGVLLRRGAAESTVQAGCVAVCAGLLDTPALLRRSRTASHPDGIGNDYGCLGGYMCGHSVSMIILLLDWKPLPPMHTKTFAINSYYGPTEDWPYPQGVIQMVGQLPLYDQPAYVRAVGARSLIAHCMTEEPSLKSVGLEFIGDEVSPRVRRAATPRKSLNRLAKRGRRIFREAGCRVVFTPRRRDVGWHGVGTARMGHDVHSSVVDARCRVHGFENLYVVDSATLPSPGAVNTGLTLMAMALRAADDIAGRETR
ncbi:MAG: GMC family oxidoreductase [Polyangiaceae bacterium]